MLKNFPPPGSRVTFLANVGPARRGDTATLVRALFEYRTAEYPEDSFVVRTGTGVEVTVRRDQVE